MPVEDWPEVAVLRKFSRNSSQRRQKTDPKSLKSPLVEALVEYQLENLKLEIAETPIEARPQIAVRRNVDRRPAANCSSSEEDRRKPKLPKHREEDRSASCSPFIEKVGRRPAANYNSSKEDRRKSKLSKRQ
jgi:hypothetical protein